MTLQESLDTLKAISAETCQAYESFDNLMVKFYEECCLHIQEIKQYNEFTRVYKEKSEFLLRDITSYLDSVDKQITYNQGFTKTTSANLEELSRKEDKLLNSLNAKEKQLDKVRDEISSCMEKKKSLDALRNKARLLRIITSTSFDFLKESNLTGYTIGNNCVKPFEFDLDKMKPEHVTTSLWNHLKKTYSEEYKAIKADIS